MPWVHVFNKQQKVQIIKKNCLTYKDWCLCYIMAQFRYVWDDDDDDWTEEFSLLTYKEEGSIVHAIATKNEEMAKMKTV